MKITIVTVCRNCKDTIESTISSVLEQTYQQIEYIIVDGMSTDGTYEIVSYYANTVKVIHEQDSGIYDAMNKGINSATGEYIYFLNSGDILADREIIKKVADIVLKEKPVLLCGNVNYVYSDGKVILHNYSSRKMLNFFNLATGITVCHQAIFARTDIMKSKCFDISYTLWADQEFIAYCLNYKYKVVYLNEIICNFDAHGFSSGEDKRGISRKECDRINKKYNRRWYLIFWIPKKMIRLLVK